MLILSFPTFIERADIIRFTGILDQQVISCCELVLTNEQAHVATLYSLYVDPTHRAQGYDSRLVSATLEAAQAHGKTVVNLRVYEASRRLGRLHSRRLTT